MKRLILLGLLLSACSPPAPVKPYGSAVLPLDANGLPPHYSLCVRNKTVKSAAIYDVYYGCQDELVYYLAERADLTQPQKAELRIELEKKAVNYAHETVVAWHGADAVRQTVDPSFKAPPRAVNSPVPLD
jgi:hypothetical protein